MKSNDILAFIFIHFITEYITTIKHFSKYMNLFLFLFYFLCLFVFVCVERGWGV